MARRPDLGYFADGMDLQDPATYADVTAPFGQARALPPAAFRSLEFALLEDEAIWTRDWVLIGMTSDIPAAGDILPFTIGNHGIHVQRMADGSLEGRFNNAQHGGCRLVPVQCQGGTKTKCSFTSCGYSRDRDAIPAAESGHGVPAMHQYLGLRPERLLRVSVAEWQSMIFVNVEAPDRQLSPAPDLERRVDGAMDARRDRTGKRWMEFDCNWKMLAETLVASDRTPAVLGDAIATERLSVGGESLSALWLFPNAVILSAQAATCLLVLQQTAIERTLCRIYTLGSDHSTSSVSSASMLLEEITGAAAKAVAGQRRMAQAADGTDAIQRDPVAYWSQTTLVRRVMDMPRIDLPLPMFQSTRHYAI